VTSAGPRELSFNSGGERCAAWYYPPGEGPGPHPLVILAHGFGGTYEGRLWAYAERFRDAGVAALAFDYRHFGESTGEPRQLLSISRQHDDWRAAIGFGRSLDGVDPTRVALWGTSLSGGHVVAVAADDPRIAAVIAQTPFADGVATVRQAGFASLIGMSAAGLRDLANAALGREPETLAVVGRPGERAAMNQPDSYEGYYALYERPGAFNNEACARIALTIGGYRPGLRATKLSCPLLVLTCAADAVTPPAPARRMADRAPLGRSIEYPPEVGGHFAIYVGELFERTVADQIAFLRETLSVESSPEPMLAAASTGD
jgi:fermentation-respiration switch protein FrsA (DUF1100 family)